MPRFDLPLAELRGYLPTVAEPHDFDEFWTRTRPPAGTPP
jgi:cephalosporin-C deacetylase